MFSRSLKIGLIALLLAGFTATVAAAGETRKSKDRKSYEEEENGRKHDRKTSPRKQAPAPAPTRTEVNRGRNDAKVAPRGTRNRDEVRRQPNRYREDVRRSRQPAPVRSARHRDHGHHRRPMVWVRGYHEKRTKRIWVAGHYKRKKVPAVYGMRTTRCGDRVRFLITAETHRRVYVPGHYKKVKERVWVPGRWVEAHSRR